MAHFYMRRDVYKSGGREAAARVAYITRQPVRSLAERQVHYISAGREDCLFVNSRNLPVWSQGQAHVYFAAAEQYEGCGWVAFEELKIGLPVELTHGQNTALIGSIVEVIAGQRLPCTYAFHCPTTMDDTQEQPHVHMILSRRQNDGIERTVAQHFKRYNKNHPERGGAPKDPAFAERLVQRQLRVLISDVVNLHLERVGSEARVHPGTLLSRGIARDPEPKLRPKESREYREQQKVSPRLHEVFDVRHKRQTTRATEQANAQAYWQARKADLGLSDTLTWPEQLTVVAAARTGGRAQPPRQRQAEGYAGVEADDRTLGDLGGEWLRSVEAESQTVWAEETALQALYDVGREAVEAARTQGTEALTRAIGERQARQQAAAARQHTRHVEHLVSDLQALMDQLDALSAEEGSGPGVRVELWEREKRDQGLSF